MVVVNLSLIIFQYERSNKTIIRIMQLIRKFYCFCDMNIKDNEAKISPQIKKISQRITIRCNCKNKIKFYIWIMKMDGYNLLEENILRYNM